MRIARDLHDLLGHSLSLIAVKSELAGRLIGTGRARLEVHDIEAVARAALPIAVEAVLSWVLREGVTNVIRHSHGRHCRIRIAETSEVVHLEVIDDGHGGIMPPDSGGGGGGGSGLAGMAERVALFGGTCSAGPCASGGFRLAVSVSRSLPDSGAP